jgi:hypothetical protein
LARFKFLTFIQQFLYQRKSNSIDENDEWWLFKAKVSYGFFLGPTSGDPKSCAIIIHILLHGIYILFICCTVSLQQQQSSGGGGGGFFFLMRRPHGWDMSWSLEFNESRIPPQSHTETHNFLL